MTRAIVRATLLALAVLPAAGCSSPNGTVSGEVTYDGQPVTNGTVTFLPTDGKGAVTGGPVTDGHYRVENVPPGPKLVLVEAVKKVPFARSSEEMAQRHADKKAKGDGSGLIDPADEIPANAEGNNAKFDVAPGQQAHNLSLKKPAGKGR
jgi:hypothetical protein